MTPAEALTKYRRRVAVEHAISSLKNEVSMKPLRVWRDFSVRGRMILGLLIEAVMAIIRHLVPKSTRKVTRKGVTRVEEASPSLKKLVFSLCQLTATSVVSGDGTRNIVYSNMDDGIRGLLTSIKGLGEAPAGV